MLAAIATLTLAAALGVAGDAEAVTMRWTAPLDQSQEVTPPTGVPAGAGGLAKGLLDTATGHLTWKVTYENLSGPPTMMHFHGPAPVGVNAPITVDIGAISGLASPAKGSTTISASQVAEVLDHLWFVNVHTMANMPGEIRGQVAVAPIPLPAGLPLALGALAALSGLRLLRRSATA